jgi:hypothetical protein
VRRTHSYGASAVSQFRPYSAQTEEATASEERLALLIVREEARMGSATSGIGPGLAGALAAALVGGIVWGYVIIKTDYEVGFLAWGLGFVSGYAVLTLARGRRSVELQVIASVGAVLGIVIGKYVAYVHFFQDYVGATFGEEFASRCSTSTPRSSATSSTTLRRSSPDSTSSGVSSPSRPPGGSSARGRPAA